MNILNNYNAAIRFTRGLAFSFEEFLHQYDERDRVTADFSYITGHEQPFGPHSYIRRTIINELTPSADMSLSRSHRSQRSLEYMTILQDLLLLLAYQPLT